MSLRTLRKDSALFVVKIPQIELNWTQTKIGVNFSKSLLFVFVTFLSDLDQIIKRISVEKIETAPTHILTDEEVIKRILEGEKHLFEKIMRKYNQRMYRICMSIINDSTEAEEIMQIAYIKAYESLRDFKFKSSLSTWLIRILINESLKHKKRRQQIENFDGHSFIINQKEAASSDSPLQKVINDELQHILEKALVQLPEKYRLVFMMREVEKMSTNETMDSLNLSESNVKIRLNRAKEMLRTSLTEYYKTEEVFDFLLTRCDTIVEKTMGHILKEDLKSNA